MSIDTRPFRATADTCFRKGLPVAGNLLNIAADRIEELEREVAVRDRAIETETGFDIDYPYCRNLIETARAELAQAAEKAPTQ